MAYTNNLNTRTRKKVKNGAPGLMQLLVEVTGSEQNAEARIAGLRKLAGEMKTLHGDATGEAWINQHFGEKKG